ncbi:MAG TPA: response regulator, partial [Kofleriaceae bacterium]|nr:response regulator [Kofleriaceae bacterium]
ILEALPRPWPPGGLAAAVARAREVARLRRQIAERERKSSVARLSEERRRLGLMVEHMVDGLILTDPRTGAVLINPAARTMLGIDDGERVTAEFLKDRLGFYPFDLVPQRSTLAPAAVRENLRIGDRQLSSVVSTVCAEDGETVGIAVILRDITEDESRTDKHREIVATMSHELRTPLTSITGALDLLLQGYVGEVSDRHRRYLQMARDASARLNLTIDEILDATRAEKSPVAVKVAPIALDDLLREVASRYQEAAAHKSIRMVVRSGTGGFRIVADPDRLAQVLTNLLSNAVKFTPAGGDIEVAVFGPEIAAGHVGVSVYNNGDPIPPEARERVFESFENLAAVPARRVGGSGLGLAISRSIVEAHGGRMWVEDRKDGTKFVFTLPSAPSPAPPTADGGDSTLGATGRVVIAADDPATIYILKGILLAAGHDVTVAHDPDEVLALARTSGSPLIVVDADNHQLDARALIEICKHDPDTRKSPVLVVSASGDRSLVARAGADDLLAKPLEPDALTRVVARLFADCGGVGAERILVVDDDPSIRAICRDMLESAGFVVREAEDGARAVTEARAFRPDLCLLDVMMPELSGFEAAQILRADAATSMTPLIFLSARGETADKVRAFRIGAEDYIVKPFDGAELLARVKKALERRERELGASPTTQLPGSGAIEAEIERRLDDGQTHAFCYLDLDNLKSFNDYYGYAKADAIIRQTGDLVRDAVTEHGTAGDFIGHIAGDDFVFVTSADTVDAVCTAICSAFDRVVPLYYNKSDRDRGFIETKDRFGVHRQFPLMGVSLASVTAGPGSATVTSYGALAVAAAAGKKLAKSVVQSSYVRDGELRIGGPAKSEQPQRARASTSD